MRLIIALVGLFVLSPIVTAQNKPLEIGDLAPEIELQTPQDEVLTLASLKGKIVLIDFWATWCAPCVKEQPELLKLYNAIIKEGKGDKFEILGVSLDRDKEEWKQGIEKFNIPWPQVSDLKFWRSQAAKDYNLQGIPYNVVINEEGEIIALNLHGEELTTFVLKAVL